jgi:hypothetical protein
LAVAVEGVGEGAGLAEALEVKAAARAILLAGEVAPAAVADSEAGEADLAAAALARAAGPAIAPQ